MAKAFRSWRFKGEPDSDHGGKEILEKLKQSKDTWSSDRGTLNAIPEVKTYNMCERRFN